MVRIMIMATMHDITTTTMSELRMLNQCTRPPGMRRYASQRDDHAMSLGSQNTSYVYTIFSSATVRRGGGALSNAAVKKTEEHAPRTRTSRAADERAD
jgi:hypothetical protein